MSWTPFGPDRTRADVVRYLTRSERFNVEYDRVASAVRTRHIWHLLQHKKDGGYMIAIDGLRKRENGWEHLFVTEHSSPNLFDVPVAWLSKPPTEQLNEVALKWRQTVAEWQRSQKELEAQARELEAGTILRLSELSYELIRKHPKDGWVVVEVSTGEKYHMTTPQVVKALAEASAKATA